MLCRLDDGSLLGWVQTAGGLHSVYFPKESLSSFPLNPSTIRIDEELVAIIMASRGTSYPISIPTDAPSAKAFLSTLESLIAATTGTASTFASSSKRFPSSSSASSALTPAYLDVKTVVRADNFVETRLSQLLMAELNVLGWEKVIDISDDFQKIKLQLIDLKGRKHSFEIEVSGNYPKDPPRVYADLPHPITLPSMLGENFNRLGERRDVNLSTIFKIVDNLVMRYQSYFDEILDLDTHTFVIEPVTSTFAVSYRRIALSKTCSMMIEIDPSAPRKMCPMQFLGPVDTTVHHRVSIAQNAHAWSSEHSIRKNLETVLGISLPKRRSAFIVGGTGEGDDDDYSVECGICYTYSISVSADADFMEMASGGGDASSRALIPDQICSNSKCSKMFHHSCLLDWLQSLPSSRCSFGKIFGTCPYCNEPMTVQTLR